LVAGVEELVSSKMVHLGAGDAFSCTEVECWFSARARGLASDALGPVVAVREQPAWEAEQLQLLIGGEEGGDVTINVTVRGNIAEVIGRRPQDVSPDESRVHRSLGTGDVKLNAGLRRSLN